MTELMEAHRELSEELELILETLIHPDYLELPEYMKEELTKERNRLEMLLEVLEEDPLYERVVL